MILSLLIFVGCDGKVSPSDDTASVDPGNEVDGDGDGYAVDEDCDDDDADINPAASEVCDGRDNNCDDLIDDGVATTWYADADADGFGDPDAPMAACTAPEGYLAAATDCDDTNADVWPGAPEVCDGVDNDCDELVDEDGLTEFYADLDGDGYGDPADHAAACTAPDGYVEDDGDCDDADVDTHAGAPELCDAADNDCDDVVDEETGLDATWYEDRDEDGFGDTVRSVVACAAPDGYVAVGEDCDDLAVDTNPGALELCDGEDDDCDGTVDESDAVDAGTWYADVDGDGFGDAGVSLVSCGAPAGYVADATDCDDGAAAAHPGATETCDGTDEDCDGTVDEADAVDAGTWYADSDNDGYGNPGTGVVSCSSPAGYVADATDCDDTAAAAYPGATETCDGTDEDCDGTVDESSAVDAATWFADRDTDGFGDAASTQPGCTQPAGYVANGADCDDTDASIFVGAVEFCNGADDDCDAIIDEADAADAGSWYADSDGDLYGNPGVSQVSCTAPSGYVANATDCDDASSSANPGATEVCDGDDNDCDGGVDESGAYGETSWYVDADGDGYGAGAATRACTAPAGRVATSTDCDDGDTSVNPGETDYCDGTDDDCDGTEDGLVSFQNTLGLWIDYSSTWGAGTYASPQAVTMSSSGTLYVCDGTYYVNVTASAANLTVQGTGESLVVLDGGGSGRTFYSTGNLTLNDLTLTNGYTASGSGGNLFASGDATLENVSLTDGSAGRGGNVACSSCTLDMTDVTIEGGDANNYGGGLYSTGGTVTGDAVAITGNTASWGAGVYMTSSSTLTFDDSDISDNVAANGGGGWYQIGGTTTFRSSTLEDNDGGDYGGGGYLYSGSFTMSSLSNVDGNTADVLGGGFYQANTSSLTCTGSSTATSGIWGNTALAAGGVYMAATASLTSTRCDWTATSDNTLYDVVVGYLLFYSKGDNATFTCDSLGC